MSELGAVSFKDAPLIMLQRIYDNSNILASESVTEILEWIDSGEEQFFNDYYYPDPWRSGGIC